MLWFTGLSGAGKSTIANLVETELHRLGCHTYMLDGDNVRHGLNKDLGFTQADRVENIRRIAEVARLMTDAGLIVLVSLHLAVPVRAPDGARADGGGRVPRGVRRHAARGRRGARPEGALREGARAASCANFTGIDSPYEPPEHAELRLDTTALSAEECAAQVVRALSAPGDAAGS